jgi:ATP-dependent Zn protease
MKTIKISLKANPRNNALGFVFHKQGSNLLKTKGDIEHDVRVLLGGMANEELFFGEDGTTNGAHNDITRVTKLLHHAVAEMGMYRKTRLNFGALVNDGGNGTVGRGNAQHHGSPERAPLRRDQGRPGAPEAADRAPGRQADGVRRDDAQ